MTIVPAPKPWMKREIEILVGIWFHLEFLRFTVILLNIGKAFGFWNKTNAPAAAATISQFDVITHQYNKSLIIN